MCQYLLTAITTQDTTNANAQKNNNGKVKL